MTLFHEYQLINKAFSQLLHTLEENSEAEEKKNSEVLLHFLHYYKTFSDAFESKDLEGQEELHQHFLKQHDELGKSIGHISKGLKIQRENVPSFLEEKVSANPAENVLRQRLQQEMSRLGTLFRKFKQAKKPRKKRPPSSHHRKV